MQQHGEQPKLGPLASCLSIDLEVSKTNGNLIAIAAYRPDTHDHLVIKPPINRSHLERLQRLSNGANFLLGHNILDFDLPHLQAHFPYLKILDLPIVDTLRLNPLAFPRRPYHHLVKHYKEANLVRSHSNDPLLDTQLAVQAFSNQLRQLRNMPPPLLAAWHWLTAGTPAGGFDIVFRHLRQATKPKPQHGIQAALDVMTDRSCPFSALDSLRRADTHPWPLAFALAWLPVAGTGSVTPPWVLHKFPETLDLLKTLRDTPCTQPDCPWCAERHDPRTQLNKWFQFPTFRPQPADTDGTPLQEKIIRQAMAGKHTLGILPTGTGKSICYQLPALVRHDNTGSLTVVISPLVALMADQVKGLEDKGISSCVTINSLLSMPERREAQERTRLGDASILIISPEQLRTKALQTAIDQRHIGAWVLDEAHCLSKWGHDFRPDYRYIGRFIAQRSADQPPAPILCLTATAKPDVKEEINLYFRQTLNTQLHTVDGGAERHNLRFDVIQTTRTEKNTHLRNLIETHLPPDTDGGAIIFCATRKRTEDTARYLTACGIEANHFHAGLQPDTKGQVQRDFISGRLRAIAATNAFGMGIDKPDIRLVIHADVPGSLENYLQEAGRAGRDNETAHCVLLYDPEDIERQHSLNAINQLDQSEINAVLKALQKLDRKTPGDEPVIATAGEILRQDEDQEFNRDSATDDTRTRTAVSWLEEAELLSRNDNHTTVFPSSLRVQDAKQANAALQKQPSLSFQYRGQLLKIVRTLINADPTQGISTDTLCTETGLDTQGVRKAITDLDILGLVSNDTQITAYVRNGIADHSRQRLERAADMEQALITLMQEQAPDQEPDPQQTHTLHLRHTSQQLRDQGVTHALPLYIQRTLRSIATGTTNDSGLNPHLRVRNRSNETMDIALLSDWQSVHQYAKDRRTAARSVLEHLLSTLSPNDRGADILVETTIGRLTDAIRMGQQVPGSRDADRLLHQALLWLHDQEAIRLNRGMTVLRPAMTITVHDRNRAFADNDYQPLLAHYSEQTLQVHIIAEYAQKGLDSLAQALQLALDYFTLPRDAFINRWMRHRQNELRRQTTPQSWQNIVESLGNRRQRDVVADERKKTNVLLLAGPGSGKTKVLVHRIAYLIRARRVNPKSIIALAYNRHAAVQIRQRLNNLIGDDATPVTIMTCHALAMRIAGATFQRTAHQTDLQANRVFDDILRQAIALLEGKNAALGEADELRDQLLAGFQWILVDEYQDIKDLEYQLIAALAGRTKQDPDKRLNLFAVGDDDQNIYTFSGSSTKYIRRFEEDYRARSTYMTENYRSTRHIIDAANTVIQPAAGRMKQDHPITPDRRRKNHPPGGHWASIDPVVKGRVQVLPSGEDHLTQAQVVVQELKRLSNLDPDWDWAACAVIARNWRLLDPVRSLCQMEQIPAQLSREDFTATWQLRETQALVHWAHEQQRFINTDDILDWLTTQPQSPWNELLQEAADTYALETANAALPPSHFTEWLAEWAKDNRRRQHGLLLTSAHRAKGLEFDHVVILDGGWDRATKGEDRDAPRRLYYVSMTRAKKTLTLARTGNSNPYIKLLAIHDSVLHRTEPIQLPPQPDGLTLAHTRLSLSNVDLSFSGRRTPDDPIHKAIAGLKPGDPLTVNTHTTPWELLTPDGIAVGRLAKSFTPPSHTGQPTATVLAIATWDKNKSETQFQHMYHTQQWEVVIPEIVTLPQDTQPT